MPATMPMPVLSADTLRAVSLFAGMHVTSTGGNCTALEMPCSDASYLLITSQHKGPQAPTKMREPVTVSWYADGESEQQDRRDFPTLRDALVELWGNTAGSALPAELSEAPAINPENALRVAGIDQMLGLVDIDDMDEVESTFVDLLANLRHACDARGLSFADLSRQAYRHYIEEK